MSGFYYVGSDLYVDCGYGDYIVDVAAVISFDISSLPVDGGAIIDNEVWYADGVLSFDDNDGSSIDVSYDRFVATYG